MAHLYRGELARADRWRTRLDTTTNWALTTTAAVLSFGFASESSPHAILLIGIWMVVSFLMIEARRYRYYDLWNRRSRLLEEGYWAPLLRREPLEPDAIRELAYEMERPQIQLSLFAALSTRMNRAYGPLLIVLVFTWFVKLLGYPDTAEGAGEIVARATLGPVHGVVVLGVMSLFTLGVIGLFAASYIIRSPLGELRTRPRSRQRGLWEAFARTYETGAPRRDPGRVPHFSADAPTDVH